VSRKKGRTGADCHIYLDREQEFVLDAIGETMGRRRLGVKANRSQLIATAIRNFIGDCEEEEDLRSAIREARELARNEREKAPENPLGG
jgi:metal-responsive CopG/Arc/MetJ family transcriptional regulator